MGLRPRVCRTSAEFRVEGFRVRWFCCSGFWEFRTHRLSSSCFCSLSSYQPQDFFWNMSIYAILDSGCSCSRCGRYSVGPRVEATVCPSSTRGPVATSAELPVPPLFGFRRKPLGLGLGLLFNGLHISELHPMPYLDPPPKKNLPITALRAYVSQS